MKNTILLIALMVMTDLSHAVCSSPISRTNFSALQVLTATRLNADLNAVYSQVNELPGDCIEDETITSSKILNGTIVNADISASAAIAQSKIAANYAISSSDSGSFLSSSTSYVDVTNLTATITTTGKPVEIFLIGKDANDSYIGVGAVAAALATAKIKVVRGSTDVSIYSFEGKATGATAFEIITPPSSVRYIDIPAAGTYTYKIQALVGSLSYAIALRNIRLVVKEL